jgi:hypothetical protein
VTYEDFFTEEEVAIYKMVKRGSMLFARIARRVAAEMVGGYILKTGKEFVHTEHGMFRLAMAENSDNSTERIAHIEMGAKLVVMGNPAEMQAFFALHDLNPRRAMYRFHKGIEREIIDA